MFKIGHRRKKIGITDEEVRIIAREEALTSERESKVRNDEEKRKALRKRKIEGLPKPIRLKLLRYLKSKEAQDGKK